MVCCQHKNRRRTRERDRKRESAVNEIVTRNSACIHIKFALVAFHRFYTYVASCLMLVDIRNAILIDTRTHTGECTTHKTHTETIRGQKCHILFDIKYLRLQYICAIRMPAQHSQRNVFSFLRFPLSMCVCVCVLACPHPWAGDGDKTSIN